MIWVPFTSIGLLCAVLAFLPRFRGHDIGLALSMLGAGLCVIGFGIVVTDA